VLKTIIAYEDDSALRHQLESIFYAIRQDFYLAKTFADAQNVISDIETHKPDAILMDIQMLDEDDGLVALYQIKQYDPTIKVMVLTMFDTDDKIFNAICLKADGYMLKSEFSAGHIPHIILRKSLNLIFEGNPHITPSVAAKILRLFTDESVSDKIRRVKSFFQHLLIQRINPNKAYMKYKFTKTQVVVLEKIVEGKTTHDIAHEMNISENTVNTHIKAVYHVFVPAVFCSKNCLPKRISKNYVAIFYTSCTSFFKTVY
jgi:DNA-binding NarL/FixJ family response regulator